MSALDKLEEMIRQVVREEIAGAIPLISEHMLQSMNRPSPKLNESRNTGTMPSVRELLAQNISWDGPEMDAPGVVAPFSAPRQDELIVPGTGGYMADGRPVPAINETTKPVYEAMNKDYSALMKKMNLV